MSFAIPLRKWYILKQKLVFPTPSATALEIRALRSGPGGAQVAKQKATALGIAFAASFTRRVVSRYAPGILWDWHPFRWIASWGGRSALAADNWGFVRTFSFLSSMKLFLPLCSTVLVKHARLPRCWCPHRCERVGLHVRRGQYFRFGSVFLPGIDIAFVSFLK